MLFWGRRLKALRDWPCLFSSLQNNGTVLEGGCSICPGYRVKTLQIELHPTHNERVLWSKNKFLLL